MDIYFLLKMVGILLVLALACIGCVIVLRKIDYQERVEAARQGGQDHKQIHEKSLVQIIVETLANIGVFGTGIGYVVGAFFLAQIIAPALPPILKVDAIGVTMLIILFPLAMWVGIKAIINNV